MSIYLLYLYHITLSRLGDHELSICLLFTFSPRYSRHGLQNPINLSAAAANERLSPSAPAAKERSSFMSELDLFCCNTEYSGLVLCNVYVIGHVDRVRSMKIAVLLNNKGVSLLSELRITYF